MPMRCCDSWKGGGDPAVEGQADVLVLAEEKQTRAHRVKAKARQIESDRVCAM